MRMHKCKDWADVRAGKAEPWKFWDGTRCPKKGQILHKEPNEWDK